MTLVGITGGIGTGKSHVSMLLQQRGWVVYSSDTTAKVIMATDDEVRSELGTTFGDQVLTPNGVNAPLLASLVFGPLPENDANRDKLNAIVHPRVLETHMKAIEAEAEKGTRVVAIESALIYEIDLEDGFDHIIVVDAPSQTCIDRVTARSGLSAEEVRRRIDKQMPMEQKRGLADFVIDNSGTPEDLAQATSTIAMIIEAMGAASSE
ncbi:MAG: dephospho-CoA kinase [Ignavibacteria bacterium]|nr:dephospho-CoA kinase [Ignavibacteria bacterium]